MTSQPIFSELIQLIHLTAPSAAPAEEAATSLLSSLMSSRIDQTTCLFMLALGLFGFFSGAIRQVANLAALIAAYFAAGPLGAKLGPVLADMTGLPLFFLTLAACIAAFFLVYGLAYLALRALLKRCLPDGERGVINRFGGLLIGGAKAAIIAFVVLSGMVLIEGAVGAIWQRFPQEVKTSRAYDFARKNSLFARLAQFETLQTVIRASGSRSDPKTLAALEQLANDSDLAELARNPRISSIALDPSIQRALTSGNYAALFSNQKLLDALNDQELFDHLGRVRAKMTLLPPGDEAAAGDRGADGPAAPQRSRAEEIENMQGER